MGLSKYWPAVTFGAIAGVNWFSALEKIIETTNAKAIVLEKELSISPEITKKVYDVAKETAERITSADLYEGLICSIAGGACLGACIYYACRKEKIKED